MTPFLIAPVPLTVSIVGVRADPLRKTQCIGLGQTKLIVHCTSGWILQSPISTKLSLLGAPQNGPENWGCVCTCVEKCLRLFLTLLDNF